MRISTKFFSITKDEDQLLLTWNTNPIEVTEEELDKLIGSLGSVKEYLYE